MSVSWEESQTSTCHVIPVGGRMASSVSRTSKLSNLYWQDVHLSTSSTSTTASGAILRRNASSKQSWGAHFTKCSTGLTSMETLLARLAHRHCWPRSWPKLQLFKSSLFSTRRDLQISMRRFGSYLRNRSQSQVWSEERQLWSKFLTSIMRCFFASISRLKAERHFLELLNNIDC